MVRDRVDSASLERSSVVTDTNRLTRVTRARIFDTIRLQARPWWGQLDELEFLARLVDLDELPSTDSRFQTAREDILKHRIANDDWEDDWVFADPRFKLAAGPDEELLRFLAEMLHPVVRRDRREVEALARDLNRHLRPDGWELQPVSEISGYPVYGHVAFEPDANEFGEFEPGCILGDYRVIEFIAAGGMGMVYRAAHTRTGAEVAIKHGFEDATDEDRRRFVREVRAMLRVTHPNVMHILDADLDAPIPYFTMPKATCRLDERSDDLRQTGDALKVFLQICDGVTAIHDAGEFHRDLKPSNILLVNGRWVVSDLGLVVFAQSDSPPLTRSSALIGTECYIAPELRGRSKVAPSAVLDVFSLGVVLYELVSGADPAFLNEQVLPALLRPVVRRAMASNPAERFQTVKELSSAIRGCVAALDSASDPLGRAQSIAARSDRTAIELDELTALVRQLSPENVIVVLDEMKSDELARVLCASPHPGVQLLTYYRDAMEAAFAAGHKYSFAYAERVARTVRLIWDSPTIDRARLVALRCLIVAAVLLWRHKALDVLLELIESARDDLATEVATTLLDERVHIEAALQRWKSYRVAEPIRQVFVQIRAGVVDR